MYKAIPKEIKEQVLSRVKNDGVSALQVAKNAGISSTVVYAWLKKESAKTDCNIIEFNRLKKQNEGLYQIIGKLTVEIDKQKKGEVIEMIIKENQKKIAKNELAKSLGISRQSLYYKPIRESKDLVVKSQIEEVMQNHKSYGHRRIAIELKMNKKKIYRIMKKYGLKAFRRRIKKPPKPDDINKPKTVFKNEIKGFCPIRPNIV